MDECDAHKYNVWEENGILSGEGGARRQHLCALSINSYQHKEDDICIGKKNEN